jgi:hypothetical protein
VLQGLLASSRGTTRMAHSSSPKVNSGEDGLKDEES